MPKHCIHQHKKKNILKGYYWCSQYKKVVKNCGHCYSKHRTFKLWLEDLIFDFTYKLEGFINGRR